MDITATPALTLNVPEFFARLDFQVWLNSTISSLNGSQRATWHNLGTAPSEFSDTFIYYEASATKGQPVAQVVADILAGETQVDGSDFDELFPRELKVEVYKACESVGFYEGIIRFTNLPE
jgi:hypothetical protein